MRKPGMAPQGAGGEVSERTEQDRADAHEEEERHRLCRIAQEMEDAQDQYDYWREQQRLEFPNLRDVERTDYE